MGNDVHQQLRADAREYEMQRLTHNDGLKSVDASLVLWSRVIEAFRGCPDDSWFGAIAVLDEAEGLAGLTHGDVRRIMARLLDATSRLDRIADWHSRETGSAGMVGDFCNECGARWPCETRRMSDGTHEDLQREET